MLRRHLLITLAVVFAGATAGPLPAAAAADATGFIRMLGDQALRVIRSPMTPAEKAAYFHRVLHQDFDLDGISRFVLGPYWRVASEAERRQFQRLLEDYLVRFYGQRFARYNGIGLRVTGSRSTAAGEIVASQIIRPQQPPIEVDWRLATETGVYKITDVIIDGVSMALAQRSEVAGIIRHNGGQLAGLLDVMREQTGESSGSSAPAR